MQNIIVREYKWRYQT